MKKILLLIITITVIAIGWGCSDCLDDAVSLDYIKQPVSNNTPHFVTLQDVQNLTKALSSSTRRASSSTAPEITCYEDAEHDTLLYICDNMGDGWTIYSSDTRVPPIVAQSDSCSFAHASENEALMAWLATIAEDMKYIKHASDAELNFTPSEIEANKNFWKSISFPDEYVKEMVKDELTTRGPGGNYLLYGHWELLSVEHYTEKYDSIQRLTKTNWKQGWPYNEYCPRKSNGWENAPAGCAVIAIAQMLYFLHYHLGVPQTAPSEAYCNSTVEDYPNYDWDQYNYTSTIWYYMDSVAYNGYYGYYAAPFIANIGKLSNIEYGDSGSSVTNNNLANAFPIYGITCDYTTYNENDVKSNLLNGLPVLLRASSGSDGHVFIADRYLRKRDVTKRTYYWVYDSVPNNFPVPGNIPNNITYSYSSPYISMIGMNWGWGSYYNNDSEWVTLTGDWICQRDPYHENWNINRRMIYNFRVAN